MAQPHVGLLHPIPPLGRKRDGNEDRAQSGRTHPRQRPGHRATSLGQDRTIRPHGADRLGRRRRETTLLTPRQRTVHRDTHTRRSTRTVQTATHARHIRGQAGASLGRTIRTIRQPRRQILLTAQRRRPARDDTRRSNSHHREKTSRRCQPRHQDFRRRTGTQSAQRTLRPLHSIRQKEL